MKYLLIAGEPSGDMHAANLMKELKKIDDAANFRYFGGDLMLLQGGILLKHYREMAFMGIIPVIRNLRTIKKNFDICKNELREFKPDVVILVDYPGFNLRVAKMAKEYGLPVVYYISPKIWAWKTKRIHQIKAYVDQMYTIFPFESDFYKKYNYNVTYVGNPIFDIISEELKTEADFAAFCETNKLSPKPIIALLAGSRKHEIQSLLPVMEQVAPFFPDYQLVIAGAPGISTTFYHSNLTTDVKIVYNQTYSLLRNSSAAIVASGTATLETALLFTPQVVVYKMELGWWLEKFRNYILKTEFFSLVNLIAEKEVVKEFFHSEVTVGNMVAELKRLLEDVVYKSDMMNEYSEIAVKLKSDGAAALVARSIIKNLKKS